MERIDVVTRAATALWAQHLGPTTASCGAAGVTRLCVALALEVKEAPAGDVMLGGAYSRLQLWLWDKPEVGGIIWLRDDLERETRLFAIAHELGHYALHRGEGVSLHPACDQREVDQRADPGDLRTEDHRVEEYTPRARRELEANAFAAELLAPRAEVRRLFIASAHVDAARVAAHFGVSHTLAQRRLIDAVLAPARPFGDGADAQRAPSGATSQPFPREVIERLDEGQRIAARAPGPALVVAGPGTGKTATLVGRVAHLIHERGIPPEKTLALTFSNRAAGEMRERLARSGLPGERMPIMTIHAFAATLLREYAPRVPHAPDEAALQPEFRILDEADAFLLMEELLGALPLRHYRSLGNPTAHLRTLLADFSRARDGLLTPADYLALVEAMPLMLPGEASDAQAMGNQAGAFTAEQIGRARERALAYGVWDHALRRRGLVDFGGLIQRAVELLRGDPEALADVRGRYPELLVDEFQDTNRAAAELLFLVAGASGRGLWVVGDRNQSIYRFRGASPSNLPRLVERYPELRALTLRRCYRSVPAIVRLGSSMAARMAGVTPGGASDGETGSAEARTGALREALRPVELEAVREAGAHPAIRWGERFVHATHERLGLVAAIAQHRALGYTYGDQAILCRTHKQARQIASALAGAGIPVSQSGDFFDREEIKDALMLVALAAGPDARGLLCAAPLVVGLGYPAPGAGELGTVARALAAKRLPLPGALRGVGQLDRVAGVSPTTRAALAALGEVAGKMRDAHSVGIELAAFLLRPGGYAWRLARVADGVDAPGADAPVPGGRGAATVWEVSSARAREALAALGELVRLVWRFDTRWAREPEFRDRLSRAVTHRRASKPAHPDALEPAPDADVLPIAALHQAAEGAATAPALRCFLHYLGALRTVEAVISMSAAEQDAVHLITLHQSKGLEFPVVYLPGLAQGQFPAGGNGRDEVCPPGFRENDAAGEREAEERCLFYVGATRARDVVAFTRAASYDKPTGGPLKSRQPSALLALVDGAENWPEAAPLISDEELEQLATEAAAMGEATEADDEDDERLDAAAIVDHDLDHSQTPAEKPVYRLHELKQYLECPLQYKYARGYGLLDPAEDAVYRFHRYIRTGARALRDVREASPQADWRAVHAHLRTLWETDGPAGHAYDDFYWQAAEAILRQEWDAITAPERSPAAARALLAQPLRAELRRCIVEVTADRVIEDLVPPMNDHATPAGAPTTLLVRLHTGRPRKDDHDDPTLSLYALASRQRPGVPARIALAYLGGLLDEQAEQTGRPGLVDLVDVTERARRDAETYLIPDRKRRSKLDKLDEAARGIAAGLFAPRPEARRCAACAYCYVCPSDPESVQNGTPSSADSVAVVRGEYP